MQLPGDEESVDSYREQRPRGDPYAEVRFVAEEIRPTRIKVRCGRCARLLAEMATAPWRIKCSRCKAVNESAPAEDHHNPDGGTE